MRHDGSATRRGNEGGHASRKFEFVRFVCLYFFPARTPPLSLNRFPASLAFCLPPTPKIHHRVKHRLDEKGGRASRGRYHCGATISPESQERPGRDQAGDRTGAILCDARVARGHHSAVLHVLHLVCQPAFQKPVRDPAFLTPRTSRLH